MKTPLLKRVLFAIAIMSVNAATIFAANTIVSVTPVNNTYAKGETAEFTVVYTADTDMDLHLDFFLQNPWTSYSDSGLANLTTTLSSTSGAESTVTVSYNIPTEAPEGYTKIANYLTQVGVGWTNDANTIEGAAKFYTVTVSTDIKTAQQVEFEAYPNPVSETLNVKVLAESKIELLSTTGSTVKSLNKIVNSTQIDVSDLAAGIYFVKVSAKGASSVKRIVVQ